MNALFTNTTEIEKVASYAAFGREKHRRRSGIIIIATVIMVAIALVMVLIMPREYRLVAGIVAFLLFGAAIVGLWLKAPKASGGESAMSELGYIRTGDTVSYSYEFYEKSFSVTTDERKEYEFSRLLAVRDIGGAYQIKTADASYTLKKAGFSEGGEQKFRALMESSGIIIK